MIHENNLRANKKGLTPLASVLVSNDRGNTIQSKRKTYREDPLCPGEVRREIRITPA
jgi:hypothetical protein